MSPAAHWAAHLIGRRWSPEFRCWDLVREVFVIRYGVRMPIVAIGEEGNAAVIREASAVSGWVRANAPPIDGDIVLMQGPVGRHVGVMIAVGPRLLLLHNAGNMGADGVPRGAVIAQTLRDASAFGYHSFEFWRKQA